MSDTSELGSHNVFISYSRVDGDIVSRLQGALDARGRRSWVDWQDIPPTAEWMGEIRSAMDEADAIVFVLSPDSVSSKVCSEEVQHAIGSNKRIIPVLARDVGAGQVPEAVARLNWIVATDGDTEKAADQIVASLETDLERVRAHSRLLVQGRQWADRDEDPALLLRGSELNDAEGLVGSDLDPRPTPEQTRLVMASRRAATRRQRGAISAVTVALVLSASLGIFAWTQRGAAIHQRDRAEQQTRVARSQALAAQALANIDDHVDLAALLSLEADRIASTPQSRESLHVVAQRTSWLQHVLRGQTQPIFAVAYSPSDDILASGSLDGSIVLWDPTMGERIGDPLLGHKAVQTLAFSPDGDLLASGGDRKVILWNPRTGTQVGEPFEFQQATFVVAFSADGKTLAIGTGSVIALRDVASGKSIGSVLEGPGGIWDITFDPAERTLASGWGDGSVRLWDAATWKPIGEPLVTGAAIASSVDFSPDGDLLASGDQNGAVEFWDPATGTMDGKTINAHSPVTGLDFSPNGGMIATASVGGGVRLWDPQTRMPIGGRLAGQESGPETVAFSSDGSSLASGTDSGSIAIWGSIGVHLSGPPSDIFGVDYSSDGRFLAMGGGDGRIALWDPVSNRPIGQPFSGPRSYVNQLAFAPDGKAMAAGYGDGTVVLWDPETQEPIGDPLPGHRKGEVVVAFSPSGDILATGSWDRSVILSDPATGEQIGDPLTGQGSRIQRVAFSSTGQLASASRDGTVLLWDPKTGQRVGQLRYLGPGDISGLAYSPDGATLATGFVDGTVTMWNPETGERLRDLVGQSAGISSLAFSPDGSVLASGSVEGNIVLWDTATGERIGEPLPGYGAVWGLDFSPDGRLLASGGETGSVYVRDQTAWSSDRSLFRDRLCTVAGRNMTRAEWHQFLPSEPYSRTCPEWPVPPSE